MANTHPTFTDYAFPSSVVVTIAAWLVAGCESAAEMGLVVAW